MKQTQAATRGASSAGRGISGRVRASGKRILDKIFLRSKIWETRKEVADIRRAVPAIERDLDVSVTLLSKKIDYLVAKIDAYADVDDKNHAALQTDLTNALAALQKAGIRSAESASKPPAAKPKPERKADPSRPFIADIEPFLYGRPITYVDVGAYQGTVFDELLNSQIRVRSAHLIEPNPKTFSALQAKLADYTRPSLLACHNLAISDAAGVVAMRGENGMTHVLGTPETVARQGGLASSAFEVNAVTLDEFAASCGIDHIALLKVDVEGHELSAFKGARGLLESESVDIIYVEAGMDPDSTQQAYYRSIEDVLRGHGYRLFKIYEQVPEWLEDSPALRRINMAFMSARFVAHNPYKLTRDLFALRRKNEELKAEVARFKSVSS